jgi:O-antigen chain-terminating methyltransferase
MSDNFYRAFEDRYRGTRELIASRLRVYLTFVEPLLAVYPQGQTVDLGSGRGEWLELMLQVGFKPSGVDLDEGMLQACYQLGLPAQQGEAISFLKALPDESQVVVSAFHVVEHIQFEQMQTLVSQALRVLKPGGLLILETPNPENIVVASCNFHLDPSHLKPIPPDLLGFLVQHAGFAKVKTLRLQEPPQLAQQANVSLQDVLTGPSPDYAIVAQKAGTTELLELTNVGFNTSYGISLADLTNRWDSRIDRLETQVQQSMELALQAQSESQKFQALALQAQSESQKFQGLVLLAQSESQKFQALANSTANQLQALQASRSWRLTAPLRKIMALLRTLKRP